MTDRIIFTADGRLNTKKRRLVECKKGAYVNSVPSSYKVNSTKEELCFEYIKQFNEQFKALYPFRKPLYMIADNEVGVPKFVCSTLRPSQLPYQELYDLYEVASFLSGYMIYEPLDPPFSAPPVLCSPSYAFKNHCGDTFEVSTLMCSFLLGAGYDAYVVHGYAPKYVTLKDQKNMTCPLLGQTSVGFSSDSKAKGSTGYSYSDRDSMDQLTAEFREYVPIDNSMKESVYLKKAQDKTDLSTRDDFELWIADTPPTIVNNEESNPSDGPSSIHGKSKKKKGIFANIQPNSDDMNKYLNLNRRVHSWILIRAGPRDIKEHLLVEPSTGRIYSCSNSPYVAIESVWNHVNYFVNMKPFSTIDRIIFDLDDQENWNSLFLEKNRKSKRANAKKDEEGGLMGSDDLDLNEQEGEGKNKEDDPGDLATTTRLFDSPPSWVSELTFNRSQLLMQFPPNGRRTVNYFCAKAEFFAKGSHAQMIVMKITVYLDKECTVVKEIHEWFENRKDKLYKRSRFYLGKRHFIELYHPGSNNEIKQWKEFPGKFIEIDFHVDGRLDRLYKREDYIGKRVIEYFSKRIDYLNMRAADVSITKFDGSRLSLPGGGLANELFVSQMSQTYDSDPSVKPGMDIKRKVYYVKEGKLVMDYHFAKGRVTGNTVTYLHTRIPGTPAPSEKALSQEEGLDDSIEGTQNAINLERDCFSSIKASFHQIQKLIDYRCDVELNVEWERSVYETALDSAEEKSSSFNEQSVSTGKEKSDEKLQKHMDYLTPFLRHVKDVRKITREEALEIRQNCLDSLRSRLIERQNIIETRLKDENAKLARKQEQFQRSQRDGDLSTEEYEKYCTEAMFRIQILDQRLVSHSDTSLQKYAELDNKLAMDPRLQILRL